MTFSSFSISTDQGRGTDSNRCLEKMRVILLYFYGFACAPRTAPLPWLRLLWYLCLQLSSKKRSQPSEPAFSERSTVLISLALLSGSSLSLFSLALAAGRGLSLTQSLSAMMTELMMLIDVSTPSSAHRQSALYKPSSVRRLPLYHFAAF